MTGEGPMTDTRPTCGAKTRRGTPCAGVILYPNGRCRMHGGPAASGAAASNYKHGRYSKALPARILDRISEAVNDPELGEVRVDLALVDAMIGDAAAGLSGEGSAALWRALSRLWDGYEGAADADDRDAIARGMGRIITEGVRDVDARAEVLAVMPTRIRLLDHEVRRTAALQNSISAERAFALVAALVGIIGRYVTDPDAVTAIRREVRSLAGVDVGGQSRTVAAARD